MPAVFGLKTPAAVTAAMYTGRIAETRIGEVAPVVFAAAGAGDAVARAIVDRLADELVVMAGAMIRRLHLSRRDPEVVLAGGVFRTTEAGFIQRIAIGVEAIAPKARLVRLTAPPVAGAALLGLDRLAGSPVSGHISSRVRDAIGAWDAEVQRMVSGPPASKRPSSARSGSPD